MATTILSPIILLLLLSLSLYQFIIHGACKQEKHEQHYTSLIQQTCNISAKNNNIDYAFCISALQARPERQCATLRRIGATTIKLVTSNLTDTRRHIQNVVKAGKVQWLRRCVDDCYEMYGDAIPRLREALKYYQHRNYIEASFQLTAVVAYATDCDDLFMEGTPDRPSDGCGGGFSPFSARNNAAVQLSEMGVSVINIILEGN